MENSIRLYMVSLGPGDPELLTLSAYRALRDSRAILIPTKDESGDLATSRSFQILKRLSEETGEIFNRPLQLSGEDAPALIPVHTPMRYRREDWERQLGEILDALEKYEKVSFVTMGDAGIYSTVYYILDLMRERFPDRYESTRVIPGITSFSQASSIAKKPLVVGGTILEVRPFDLRSGEEGTPRTIVYMRPRPDTPFERMPVGGELQSFQHLNFEDERIYPGFPSSGNSYMTLSIDFFKK